MLCSQPVALEENQNAHPNRPANHYHTLKLSTRQPYGVAHPYRNSHLRTPGKPDRKTGHIRK
jgi:hypothetical protein